MGKPIFLLGAGASIDAGLFDTNKLTRKIYDVLLHSRNNNNAVKLFGYVIARILVKKVRMGGSPFDNINVEEVYEGIERLVNRKADIVSEFVSSWDPTLNDLMPTFDERQFADHISRSLRKGRGLGRSDNVGFYLDNHRLRDAAREITKAISRIEYESSPVILDQLIKALTVCLEHDENKIEYMCDFARLAAEKGAVVGSLNYDLVLESGLNRVGLTADYGLENWNEKRIVLFSQRSADIKFIKLHGSMNWYETNDKISFERPEYYRSPLLIFGSGNKLRVNGPFLQLRHEFERKLLDTNMLVVMGYAFADEHLNAIIRRWVATRRKAKLIVVNPCPTSDWAGQIGKPYILKDNRLSKKSVDVIHIRKNAAASIGDISQEMDKPIDLSIETERNGLLPHVLITVVE